MRTLTNVLVLLAVTLVASSALAQDLKAVKKVETARRLAMEDFDLGDFAAAMKALLAVQETVTAAKLDKHPVSAALHVELALVHVALKAEEPAIAAFRAALDIDPAVEIPAKLKQDDVAKLFERAKAPPEKKEEPQAVPEIVTGIVHFPVDGAPEGADIAIDAKVGTDVRAKVVGLSYRPAEGKDFVVVEMKRVDATTFRGLIPAAATSVNTIHYFIDAKNTKGKLAAARGSVSSPFTITIKRTPKEEPENEGVDDENPLSKPKRK